MQQGAALLQGPVRYRAWQPPGMPGSEAAEAAIRPQTQLGSAGAVDVHQQGPKAYFTSVCTTTFNRLSQTSDGKIQVQVTSLKVYQSSRTIPNTAPFCPDVVPPAVHFRAAKSLQATATPVACQGQDGQQEEGNCGGMRGKDWTYTMGLPVPELPPRTPRISIQPPVPSPRTPPPALATRRALDMDYDADSSDDSVIPVLQQCSMLEGIPLVSGLNTGARFAAPSPRNAQSPRKMTNAPERVSCPSGLASQPHLQQSLLKANAIVNGGFHSSSDAIYSDYHMISSLTNSSSEQSFTGLPSPERSVSDSPSACSAAQTPRQTPDGMGLLSPRAPSRKAAADVIDISIAVSNINLIPAAEAPSTPRRPDTPRRRLVC